MSMITVHKLLLFTTIFLALMQPIFTQDIESEEPSSTLSDLDNLFNDQDTLDEQNNSETSEDSVDPNALTEESGPIIKGSTKIEGAFSYGLTDWPSPLGSESFSNSMLDPGIYFTMSSSVTIDARTADYLRFFASISASVDESDLSFTSPVVDELFIDYTLLDNIFFRIGKQNLTWGQGRILGNPANFVSRMGDGLGLKMFIPLLGNGLNLISYGDSGWFDGSVSPSAETLAYAGILETSVDIITLGLSAHYRPSEDLQTALYFKTVLGEVDFALENLVEWDIESGNGTDDPRYLGLLNFFWEGGDPKWRIILEYLFDSEIADYAGHRVGLAFLISGLDLGGWKPGFQWTHAFKDHSGQIVIGIDGPLAPSINASIGIPITYGPSDGYYRVNNEEPGDRVLAGIIQFTLTLEY